MPRNRANCGKKHVIRTCLLASFLLGSLFAPQVTAQNAESNHQHAAELSRAKRYLQLQLPGNFETTQQIAAALVPVALYGLPLDYYNNYVQNIEGVTQADVARVAQQYINPGSLAVVIVGDRKTIEAGLKATNVGPIAIRDISGQPIQ